MFYVINNSLELKGKVRIPFKISIPFKAKKGVETTKLSVSSFTNNLIAQILKQFLFFYLPSISIILNFGDNLV